MKTVFIAASPKKRWSNSAYLLSFTKWFTKGEKAWINFRGSGDYASIFSELEDAGALDLGMPLYVDAIPSHILILLQKIEQYVKEKGVTFRVYSLCNCGFYEGVQCEYELEMVRCWCERSGLEFCGGAGIGAGEMIGVLPLSPIISIAVLLLQGIIFTTVSLSGGTFSLQALLGHLSLLGVFISVMVAVLFSIRPWIVAAQVGTSVSVRRGHGVRFSTVSFCPAFLFVFFASIYWALRAFVLHLVPVWKLFRKA